MSVFRFTVVFSLIWVSAFAVAVRAQTFVENFTTTTYRDTTATTADWNTNAGVLQLPDFTQSIIGSEASLVQAQDLEVRGDLAFVSLYTGGLRVVDITDPTAPTVIGAYTGATHTYGLDVDGDFVYLATDPEGLLVIDVTDPSVPFLAATFVTPGLAHGVDVEGDLAMVADHWGGLTAVDITDPTSPTILGNFAMTGFAMDVEISGNMAFVAAFNGGLQIVGIWDPTNMIAWGSYDPGANVEGLDVAGDLCYLAAGSAGMVVLDVAYVLSSPTVPALVGSYASSIGVNQVHVFDNRAYALDWNSGVHVLDVSDPTAPGLIEQLTQFDYPRSVAVAGPLAIMADYNGGLQILETSAMSPPSLAGTLGVDPGAMDIWGNLLFASDSSMNYVVDLSDPESPTVIELHPVQASSLNLITDLVVTGDRVYELDYDNGLHVHYFDWNEWNPLDLGNRHRAMCFSGDLAFVGHAGGVSVVDVGLTFAEVGSINTSGDEVFDVIVDGKYVYAALSGGRVEVIDITVPTAPTNAGGVGGWLSSSSILISGDLLFIGTNDGVKVCDITDPTAIALVATIDPGNSITDLALAGDMLIATSDDVIQQSLVVDIGDPAQPRIVGRFPYGVDVRVFDRYAFINSGAGIDVYRIFSDQKYSLDNVGQSLAVATSPVSHSMVLLEPQGSGVESWEASCDGGTHWSEINDSVVTELAYAGTDLRWRVILGTGAPMVSQVQLSWYNPHGPILSITDVPSDQGGRVDVTLGRSGYDFVAQSQPVTGYNVYRRVDESLKSSLLQSALPLPDGMDLTTADGEKALPLPGMRVLREASGDIVLVDEKTADKTAFPAGTWKIVGTAFATQSDTYTFEVPTAADSTAADSAWSVFVATTHTTVPGDWYISLPDSGYSVDNIAPGVPAGMTAAYAANGVGLNWDDASEADFQYYNIYRGSSADFAPDQSNLLHKTAQSEWFDATAEPWQLYYKVTALDHAGNESDPGTASNVTGIDIGDVPGATVLEGVSPNPFNPSTTIRFTLTAPGPVRLEVYDVAGRQVASLLNEEREAGRHQVRWDGKDDDGHQLPSGVYFCRFVAGDRTQVGKMVLVQ